MWRSVCLSTQRRRRHRRVQLIVSNAFERKALPFIHILFLFSFLCFSLSINLYENQSNDHFFFSSFHWMIAIYAQRAPADQTQVYAVHSHFGMKTERERSATIAGGYFRIWYEMSIVGHAQAHQRSNDRVKVFRNFECGCWVGAFFLLLFIRSFYMLNFRGKEKAGKIVDCCQPDHC